MSRHSSVMARMEAEIRVKCAPIMETIRASYAEELAAAKLADEEAEERYKQRLVEGALIDALWPIGTKLVEWSDRPATARPATARWSSHKVPWHRTGVTGFYEIYDKRSSAKVIGIPHGSLFVRLAKKDGTPGARGARGEWHRWLPDGRHPDTYEHPAAKRKAIAL